MENENSAREKRLARWDRYPAVEALIRIGKPSVPAMLRNLENSDSDKVRQLSAKVIYYVEGGELARIVVENAIAKQSDPGRKEKLKSSLSYLGPGMDAE